MTTDWISLPTLQDVAKAQADYMFIERQIPSSNHWASWDGEVYSSHWKFRGRHRQPVLTVDLPVTEVVQLQNSADGLWAHFRVGKGYAYSINLDVDKIGHRFANEYREAVGGKPIQPVMKEVKILCYFDQVIQQLVWSSADAISGDWIRQPHLDMIAKVPG